MVTSRSSNGCRITSNTVLLNSGNSSKNKTPLCDSEISPGCGYCPPPTKATSLAHPNYEVKVSIGSHYDNS